ncbi:methyltransferase domain-containing protein [Massilia sp. GCM10023247]|uniref:methyltransferase domain-containing protein n=1 Tax=Massilia sp. GCM10023247 TaxID=3252643 RepID=UPI0036062228
MKPFFPRLLAAEILDELSEDDPRAVRSRQDLGRINYVMGTAGILVRALTAGAVVPGRMIEFGAGDGSLMLRLAQRLAPRWPGIHVVLLDRQHCIAPHTREAIARTGWTVQVRQEDVADWISGADGERFDIALANLFIHHFDEERIVHLFNALSARTDVFVACEPRRAPLPLLASRLVGLLGANEVTRSDAVASVRAGFQGEELSSLWPANPGWRMTEQRAGLFSHVFTACRRTVGA